MTIGKFMTALGGTGVILLLLLVLYFLRWDGSADQDRDRIIGSVKAWEQIWKHADPSFEIAYDDLAVRGFPFSTKVNLMRPQVTLKLPEGTVHFSTAFLSFARQEQEDGNPSYRLGFLADIVVMFYPADGSDPQSYMLHLSQVPQVEVRAVAVGGRQPQLVNGWTLSLPGTLFINVLHGDDTGRQVSLNVGAVHSTKWIGIPQNIGSYIATLFHFVRDVSAQPAT